MVSNVWKEVAIVDCLPYYAHKAFENSKRILRLKWSRRQASRGIEGSNDMQNTIIHHL